MRITQGLVPHALNGSMAFRLAKRLLSGCLAVFLVRFLRILGFLDRC